VVRAVLFYSPTCPHCHQVINEVLLPMVEEHGDRLQVVAIDVSQAGGQALYQSAIEHFAIPEERLGVPTLIVGDTVLVGSGEIPDQFPDILGEGLVAGIDWPAIPDFVPPSAEAAADAQETPTALPPATETPPVTDTAAPTAGEDATAAPVVAQESDEVQATPEAEPPTAGTAPLVLDGAQPEITFEEAEEPPADPVGFALAAAILVAMVIACAYVAWRLVVPVAAARSVERITVVTNLTWLIPIIAVLGIGIASYLAYVEVAQVTAVCGPVGHCNLVQSSTYARILGIPIAILGIATYVAVIALWLLERLVKQTRHKLTVRLSLIGLTIFGTLFSIYLTLLELFVIRAVCAWCLTSAVFMTLLMVIVARPATRKPKLAIG
jgi:uncharacterized membrane protein